MAYATQVERTPSYSKGNQSAIRIQDKMAGGEIAEKGSTNKYMLYYANLVIAQNDFLILVYNFNQQQLKEIGKPKESVMFQLSSINMDTSSGISQKAYVHKNNTSPGIGGFSLSSNYFTMI